MNILVVGGGGREHALCWKIAQSPLCSKLYCAPGNAGIADVADCVAIGAEDVDAITDFATANNIDFVVVGPESPLVSGLVDRLADAGIKAFGPSEKASILEGSKGYMKDLCAKYDIPTAGYKRFTDAASARDYVTQHGTPIVIKADGLAAGKGVTIAQTEDEAFTAIDDALLDNRFGDAGAELVIEEFMQGEEASFFALVDGENAIPLISAQDHKAVGEGDTGPNTGGMGAYSPAPVMTDSVSQKVMDKIINPTVKAMAAEGRAFKGVLFAGLMIVDTPAGPEPKLIEYNIRFGDPECQVLMSRLKSDIVPALMATVDGGLDQVQLDWWDHYALTVVLAANGYPGSYAKNTLIQGLERTKDLDETVIFHAGTKCGATGELLSSGGRVLCVTAMDMDIEQAQARAYKAVDMIDWPEGFCRRDIGWRAVNRSPLNVIPAEAGTRRT